MILGTILICSILCAATFNIFNMSSFVGFFLGGVIGLVMSVFSFGIIAIFSNINVQVSEMNIKLERLIVLYQGTGVNFSSDVPNPRSEINSKDCCFACKCGFSTSVDNDMKGKKAKCPRCGAIGII